MSPAPVRLIPLRTCSRDQAEFAPMPVRAAWPLSLGINRQVRAGSRPRGVRGAGRLQERGRDGLNSDVDLPVDSDGRVPIAGTI